MRRSAVILLALAVLGTGGGGCVRLESTYVKKVKEAEGLAGELAALRKKHDALVAAHEALLGQRDRLAAEREKLAADLADMTGQRDRLAADLAATVRERDRVRADNRELEGVLKAKSDSLSQSILELRGKNEALERDNGKLREELAGLRDGKERLEGELAALRKENGEQRETRERLARENDRLRAEADAARKAQEEKVQKVSTTYEDLLAKMKGEIDKGQVTISELKGKLTLNMVDAILFDSGKAEVKPEGMTVLEKVISILKDVKDKWIRVEGHTDNVQIVGALSKRYPTNWELSAARSTNVTRYLAERGIDPSNLSAVSYGEFRPVAGNDTPEGKAKNRRIEIILAPKD